MNTKIKIFLSLVYILSFQLLNSQVRKNTDTKILDNSFSATVLTPIDLSAVKKYEKFELSINLPDTIENKIQNFINKNGNERVNPFNPEKINITAEFSHVNDSIIKTYKRYGFYYEEFRRSGSRWVKIKNQDLFRIRFTPDKTGKWLVKLKVFINKELYWNNESLSYNVVDSDLNSFIKKGKNPHYLELNNKTFIPVGLNIPTPKAYKGDAWSSTPTKMSAYLKYHNEMQELKNNGGNYFRLLFHPWSLELEFNKLGDYSERMNMAWEMDNILEKANELDLYIHLNIQGHYPFENASAYSLLNWDWPDNTSPRYPEERCNNKYDSGYCYMRELGLDTAVEFLSSEKAKWHYKNKLRYYFSRYGYSTHIAVMELFSEINNVGQRYRIVYDSIKACQSQHIESSYIKFDTVPKLVNQWHNEISTYIKEELGFQQHLIGVSYAGKPSISQGDSSYYAKNIDVISFNKYGIDVSKRRYINMINNYKEIQKPFFFSEIGVNNKKVYSSADYIYAAREIILSHFTGAAGSFPWGLRYNPDSVWRHFSYISNFLKGLNITDTNWQVYAIDRADYKAEMYCFKNSIENKAIGIITNSTYNYYSLADNKTELRTERMSDKFKEPEDVENANFGNALKIYKLNRRKNYKIEWYDIKTNEKIGESYQKSGFLGNLKLKHPPLKVTNGEELHMIGFKVYPAD